MKRKLPDWMKDFSDDVEIDRALLNPLRAIKLQKPKPMDLRFEDPPEDFVPRPKTRRKHWLTDKEEKQRQKDARRSARRKQKQARITRTEDL